MTAATIPPTLFYSGQPMDDGPARGFFAVTPSNSVGFNYVTRALYVGVTGDVTAVGQDGTAVTFPAVPAGMLLPIACIRVNSTGTGASGIVGLY